MIPSKNSWLNWLSDRRCRKFWPIHIPIRAGKTAKSEAITTCPDSRAFVPKARARAAVDAKNNKPMACTSMSRGNPMPLRYIIPGTANDPVIPVSMPFVAPNTNPIQNSLPEEIVGQKPDRFSPP